jgi:hypothetical protein
LGNLRLLLALGGVALLGNGLKSVVTSTVLVSESHFASFLRIPVERVALLMESIVAGMVIALAVYPLAARRFEVRGVALVAAFAGAFAFAVFAAAALHADPATRAAWAFVCLTLGGAALVWLAPSAQSLVLTWPGRDGRRVLTSIWTGATPVGFLAAPQLAKWLLPGLGLSAYFASLAVLPLAFAALVAMTAVSIHDPHADDAMPAGLVTAFAAAVVAFEVWSTAGSVEGYGYPFALAALPLLMASIAWLVTRARRFAATATTDTLAWRYVAALFVLEIPTTGFFEAAFLFDHGMPQALVADRATLAAAAQIAGTLLGGVVLHRWRGSTPVVAWTACALVVAGVGGYAAYPWLQEAWYFMLTAATAGFGVGALTLVLCLAIVRHAHKVVALAALPSIAIMIGTEVGLELLQCAFAGARSGGVDAFATVFAAQTAAALAVAPLLRHALRRDADTEPLD